MFRPMMILGILVVALGFASFVFVPGWRTSPLSLVMIIALIILGGYAFTRDAIIFYREMKQETTRHKNTPEPSAPEPNSPETEAPDPASPEPEPGEPHQEHRKD